MVSPNIVIYSVPFVTLILVFVLAYTDLKKQRHTSRYQELSFIVPCYNNADHIEKTIESVYSSYANPELIVINDHSTDASLAIIQRLKKKYKFRLINHKINKGKAASINAAVDKTLADTVIIVDADVILTKEALCAMLERLSDKVAATSCPYKPSNKGFLPNMQSIEYTISKLVKYAQNHTSVLSLWGGCMAVKRKPFIEVGKFSENMLIEDVELAFKLYKNGYQVEQASMYVHTVVPSTWKHWIKQKIRWTAGGAQCFLAHPDIYFKNPLLCIFNLSQLLLIVTFIFYLIHDFHGLGTVLLNLSIRNPVTSVVDTASYIWAIDKKQIVRAIFIKFGFMFFTLPYVLIVSRSAKDLLKVLNLIPFTFIYSPAFTILYLGSWIIGIKKYVQLKEGERAW